MLRNVDQATYVGAEKEQILSVLFCFFLLFCISLSLFFSFTTLFLSLCCALYPFLRVVKLQGVLSYTFFVSKYSLFSSLQNHSLLSVDLNSDSPYRISNYCCRKKIMTVLGIEPSSVSAIFPRSQNQAQRYKTVGAS